jgi:peptidyl-prolyl cis-trans isomerase D
MIKILRIAHHRYPWILMSIMGFITITFVVGMGWWGFTEQKDDAVAHVGPLKVSREEYERAYRNFYQMYRDKVKGEFKDEQLKEFVLEGLIENKLWQLSAKDLGLSVSADELRDDILSRPDFQRNGKFDPDLYRRLLAANKLTPALFEALHTHELLRDKALMTIRDSVALTPTEIADVRTVLAHQPPGQPGQAAQAEDRLLQDLLLQKQQRALAAYRESLKASIPIKIHKELM